MSYWLGLAGYPVLNVNVTENKIHLSQKPFMLAVGDWESSRWFVPDFFKWYIPITMATQTNPIFTDSITNLWMDNDMTIELNNASEQWIIFNRLSAGKKKMLSMPVNTGNKFFLFKS